MKDEMAELSDQEKHDAAVELLKELKKKLYSDDITTARLAAHKLSWMQEDGLAMLRSALFGSHPKTVKKAAAYGLRSMRGRMRKLASQVLEEGSQRSNLTTKAACEKALFLMKGGIPEKSRSNSKSNSNRMRIREMRNKDRARRRFTERRTSSGG
jgi:uncharacterized membrane-anchored protein YjiN (DUF445 family)